PGPRRSTRPLGGSRSKRICPRARCRCRFRSCRATPPRAASARRRASRRRRAYGSPRSSRANIRPRSSPTGPERAWSASAGGSTARASPRSGSAASGLQTDASFRSTWIRSAIPRRTRSAEMRRSASALALLLLCSVPAVARDARFSIEARDVELADVIRLIGAQSGRNVVPDGSVKEQRVSLRLRGVTFDEALATVAAAYGLQTHADGRVVIVGDAASMSRRFGDDRAAGGTRTAVFALRHARPDDLLPSLQTALPAGTVIVGDKRTASLVVTANDAALARARALVAALDAPAGDASATDTFALRNVRASEALRLLKGAVPEGALVADDRRNAVAITGSADMRASARRLLASVDAPGRQVMFEVRVADVQPIDDSTNVGLQLGGAGFGTGALGQFPYTLTA